MAATAAWLYRNTGIIGYIAGSTGIMEKKMETTGANMGIIQGLYTDYR